MNTDQNIVGNIQPAIAHGGMPLFYEEDVKKYWLASLPEQLEQDETVKNSVKEYINQHLK